MSQKQQILRITLKIIIFTTPLWLLAASYFYFDPFYVLKDYESYPDNYLKSYNRNRISTQVFLNNNPKEKYDSFILGSSKSSAFHTQDWENYINSNKAYHFDASNETISGMAGKLSFINEQGNNIKNALLIMDGETFEYVADTANSVIHLQDPLWSGDAKLKYHLVFFKAYFKNFYFIKYFDVLLNETFKPYMFGVFENKHMLYTPVKNDFIFKEYIDDIARDSLAYYNRDLFYKRSLEQDTMRASIKPYQLKFLLKIQEIFEEHNTEYKIILGPNYDQKKVNPSDLKILREYFKEDHIYDFTGTNSYTSPTSNYYEIYHYKPLVARRILNEVYNK